MIIYKYKINNKERELHVSDNGPAIMQCNTEEYEAYLFVKDILEPKIKEQLGDNLTNKRILDVGMGNGNVLKYVQEQLGADVFGVDIANYLHINNYQQQKTFTNMDVRDLPKELVGTFDVVYQRLFSVPFKDSLSVLYSISKTLKPDGIYLVTFDDEEYEHENSFIINILKELFDDVIITKNKNLIKLCVAKHPKLNPKLTSMDEYYFLLNDEKYIEYRNSNLEERKSILEKISKQENKESQKKIR